MSSYRGPWFKVNHQLFEGLRLDIASRYPNLHFRIEDDTVFLSGSFPIESEGKFWDRFLIEVEFPHNYPKGVPVVREIGGRIPWTVDRHVFQTGVACLFFPYELASVYPIGTTILEYLDGPIRSFFISQSVFEKNGTWPYGQCSHGDEEEEKFFANALGTNDQLALYGFKKVIKGKRVKGHWFCPCRSGKKLRDCHFDVVNKLQSDYFYARDFYPWNKIK